MTGRRGRAAGALRAAIDIESVLHPDAAALTGSPNPSSRPALHHIVCASVLLFRQDGAHGEVRDLDLRTFSADAHSEPEIIGFVDRALPDPADGRALLISWNGRTSDMRTLRHRASALWMFGLNRLRAWSAPDQSRHRDLMKDIEPGLARGDFWALRDVCAGMGFALRPGGRTTVPQMLLACDHDAIALRNRRDVVATMLAYAAQESFVRGCDIPLASAWAAVGDLRRIDPAVSNGSSALTTHHLVEFGRQRLAETSRAGCGCSVVA